MAEMNFSSGVASTSDLSFCHHMEMLNKETEQLREPWDGSITLLVTPVLASSSLTLIPSILESTRPSMHDICQYLNSRNPSIGRLYFDRDKFPPPSNPLKLHQNVEEKAVWDSLRKYIEITSLDCSSPVVSNGGGSLLKVFNCKMCYRIRRQYDKQNIPPPSHFRKSNLINDRRANREKGRAKPRRTSRLSFEIKCPFVFSVKWDNNGFYINLEKNAGNPTHKFHPKILAQDLPMPVRLVPDEERDSLRALAQSCGGSGVGRNFLYSKLGKYLSRCKIAYLYNQCELDQVADYGEVPPRSDIDDMLDYFRKVDDVAFQVLWDIPVAALESEENGQDIPLSPDTKNKAAHSPLRGSGTDVSLHFSDTPDVENHFECRTPTKLMLETKLGKDNFIETDLSSSPDMEPIREMVQASRIDQRTPPESPMFVAVAYIHRKEIRYFKLFPEVIFVDATSHSERNKFHLLTFSVRSSTGNQVIFMRIWIPHARRVAFRWVFQHALTMLIPKKFLSRVRFVMGDNDHQQCAEIMLATTIYMKSAVRGQCAWHFIHQKWKKLPLKKNRIHGKQDGDRYDIFIRHLHTWMYSWMRPHYCETPEEYKISKAILFWYLQSKAVLEVCGNQTEIVKAIIEFVRDRVAHEDIYVFYKRKSLRHFDINTNSPHEGTNMGMKSHSAPLKATAKMSTSAKTLMLQGNIKTCQLDEIAFLGAFSLKSWSKSHTANYVTTPCESLIIQEWERRSTFKVTRTGAFSFDVEPKEKGMDADPIHSNLSSRLNEISPIPKFQRIRRVQIDPSTLISECSCCLFQRCGYGCSHILATFCYVSPEYKGFKHTDVSVRWWSIFSFYGYKDDSNMSSILDQVISSDCPGPRLPVEAIPDLLPIEPRGEELPAVKRLKNYSPEDIVSILPNYRENGVYMEEMIGDGTMSQTFVPYGMDNIQLLDDSPSDLMNVTDIEVDEPANFQASVQDLYDVAGHGRLRDKLNGLLNELIGVYENLNSEMENRNLESKLLKMIEHGRGLVAKENTNTRANVTVVPGQTVPVLSEREKSSQARHYNTYHM